jgi:hypothetical protein
LSGILFVRVSYAVYNPSVAEVVENVFIFFAAAATHQKQVTYCLYECGDRTNQNEKQGWRLYRYIRLLLGVSWNTVLDLPVPYLFFMYLHFKLR